MSSEDLVSKLKELDAELANGEITQKGYDKKKEAILGPSKQKHISKSSENLRESQEPNSLMKNNDGYQRTSKEELRLKSRMIASEAIALVDKKLGSSQNLASGSSRIELDLDDISDSSSKEEDQSLTSSDPEIFIEGPMKLAQIIKSAEKANALKTNNAKRMTISLALNSDVMKIKEVVDPQDKDHRTSNPPANLYNPPSILVNNPADNQIKIFEPTPSPNGSLADLSNTSKPRSESVTSLSKGQEINPLYSQKTLNERLTDFKSLNDLSTINNVDIKRNIRSSQLKIGALALKNSDSILTDAPSDFSAKGSTELLDDNTQIDPFKSKTNIKYGTISRRLQNILGVVKNVGAQRDKISENLNEPLLAPISVNSPAINWNDSEYNELINQPLPSIIRKKALKNPKSVAITSLDIKGKEIMSLSYQRLISRAEKISSIFLEKKHPERGSRVVLFFNPSEEIDFIISFLGCLFAGIIPIAFVPTPLKNLTEELEVVLKYSEAKVILMTDAQIKMIKKDKGFTLETEVELWKVNDLGNYNAARKGPYPYQEPDVHDIAYAEYYLSPIEQEYITEISYSSLLDQCLNTKFEFKMKSSDVVFTVMDIRNYSGLLHGLVQSLFSGSTLITMPGGAKGISQSGPSLLSMIKRYKATVFFTSIHIFNELLKLSFEKKEQTSTENLRFLRLFLVDHSESYVRTETHHERMLAFLSDKHAFGGRLSYLLTLKEMFGFNITSESGSGTHVKLALSLLSLSRDEVLILKDELANGKGVSSIIDSGWICSGTTFAIVRKNSTRLCEDGQIGEIWIKASYIPKERLYKSFTSTLSTTIQLKNFGDFYPTGIYAFIRMEKLFIVGSSSEMMTYSTADGCKNFYYTDDVNTLIKERFNHVCEVCSFSIVLGEQELPIIMLETENEKLDFSNASNFIKETLKNEMNLCPYSILHCSRGAIPRNFDGSPSIYRSRKLYDLGLLNPLYVYMNTKGSVAYYISTTVKTAGDLSPQVDMNDILSYDTIQFSDGNAIGSIGQGLGVIDKANEQNLLDFDSLARILMWRSVKVPNDIAYITVDPRGKELKSVSFLRFSKKVCKIVSFLKKKGIKSGDTAIVLNYYSLDLIYAIYSCFFLGVLVIPVSIPDSQGSDDFYRILSEVTEKLQVRWLLTGAQGEEHLKHKNTVAAFKKFKNLNILEVVVVSKAPKLGIKNHFSLNNTLDETMKRLESTNYAVAQLYTNFDETYSLTYLSHDTLIAQCTIQKETASLGSGRPLLNVTRNFNGLEFLHAVALGVYVGCPSIILHPLVFSPNPKLWLELALKYKVRDLYCKRFMLEQCLSISANDAKGLMLSNVKNIQILSENRPAISDIEKLFSERFRVDIEAITETFSSSYHPLISTRSYLMSEANYISLDLKFLRRGIVKFSNKDTMASIVVKDSGRISTCNSVVVRNLKTKEPLPFNQIGEILIASAGLADKSSEVMEEVKFNIEKLKGLQFVSTNCIGFLLPHTVTSYIGGYSKKVNGELLYVLGAKEELLTISNKSSETYYFFPSDIESTVENSHPNIIKGSCVVFLSTFTGGLVILAELLDLETDANNCVSVVVNAVLDEHQIVATVIVFSEEGKIPRSRSGYKKRIQAQKLFETGSFSSDGSKVITIS